MLTLKASVAAAILVGAMAATAGATYVATKTTVAVNCPVITVTPPAADAPLALPHSAIRFRCYQGKKW